MRRQVPPKDLPFTLLPERLVGLSATCSSCGTVSRVNLFEVKSEPMKPVPANGKPGYSWVPVAVGRSCTRCDRRLQVPIPIVARGTTVELYGDEASREEENGVRSAFSYSIVGADHKLIGTVNEAVRELKVRLAPTVAPDSWTFHMKILTSSQQRRKHPIFASWDSSKIEAAKTGLVEALNLRGVLKFNITVGAKRTVFDWAKSEAYIAIVMYVIDDMTAQGAEPVFAFDAEKIGNRQSSSIIHSWASRLFVDTTYSDLFAYLTHGIHVQEPRFVVPASHPCLELADFLAYVVARSQYNHWRGRQSELDTALFGQVVYLGFDKVGNMHVHNQIGFPFSSYR